MMQINGWRGVRRKSILFDLVEGLLGFGRYTERDREISNGRQKLGGYMKSNGSNIAMSVRQGRDHLPKVV